MNKGLLKYPINRPRDPGAYGFPQRRRFEYPRMVEGPITTVSVSGTSTTYNVNMPTVTHIGDLFVMYAYSFTNTTLTLPSNWNFVYSGNGNAAGVIACVVWKISDGTEAGTTPTFTMAAAGRWSSVLYRVQGNNTLTQPFSFSNIAISGIAPPVTPVRRQQPHLWLAFTGGGNVISTFPNGYSDTIYAQAVDTTQTSCAGCIRSSTVYTEAPTSFTAVSDQRSCVVGVVPKGLVNV